MDCSVHNNTTKPSNIHARARCRPPTLPKWSCFTIWAVVHAMVNLHDDVIKWKYFPRYWPFVREIHRSPVNFPHKGQWRGALMFTLICDRMNGWVNNHEASDSRRYLAHCDVIVMLSNIGWSYTGISMSQSSLTTTSCIKFLLWI